MPSDSSCEDDCYRRYLLGLLADEETERLDELTLVDHEAAARLQSAEYDLIDAYLTGTLTADLHATFERVYSSTPRRRDKVQAAQSLRQAARASETSPADDSKPRAIAATAL